jgi:hypothetical protein
MLQIASRLGLGEPTNSVGKHPNTVRDRGCCEEEPPTCHTMHGSSSNSRTEDVIEVAVATAYLEDLFESGQS